MTKSKKKLDPEDTGTRIGETKYRHQYPEVVEWLAANGYIDKEIAKRLGISPRTLRRWKKEYPELMASLKRGKDATDGLVEASLFKRAMGSTFEEVKQVISKTDDGKPFIQRVEKTKKQIMADVLAQIYWLNNRNPERWRDRREIEHSGEIKGGFNVIVLEEEKGV